MNFNHPEIDAQRPSDSDGPAVGAASFEVRAARAPSGTLRKTGQRKFTAPAGRTDRKTPARIATGRSDQDRTAIHDEDLAGAVGLPHEIEVRLRDLRRVADVTDW
jgi:hypothetical protein